MQGTEQAHFFALSRKVSEPWNTVPCKASSWQYCKNIAVSCTQSVIHSSLRLREQKLEYMSCVAYKQTGLQQLPVTLGLAHSQLQMTLWLAIICDK